MPAGLGDDTGSASEPNGSASGAVITGCAAGGPNRSSELLFGPDAKDHWPAVRGAVGNLVEVRGMPVEGGT